MHVNKPVFTDPVTYKMLVHDEDVFIDEDLDNNNSRLDE